jgi:hypothetical protein
MSVHKLRAGVEILEALESLAQASATRANGNRLLQVLALP